MEKPLQNTQITENKSPIKKKKKKKKKRDIINNSGQGNVPVVKVVSDRFNWGAFLLTFIWGIAHKCYITLLIIPASFIPILNLILPIWFGLKGNTWAWQNKRYRSINEFHENQKKWAIAGTIISLVTMIFAFCMAIYTINQINTIRF